MCEPDDQHCRLAHRLVPIFTALLLTACDVDAPAQREFKKDGEQVVARIGSRAITLQDVDREIPLERHDLALAEYQLRFNTLKLMVDAEPPSSDSATTQRSVDWLLPYPSPPRLEISTDGRSLRGNPAAPVTLAVFCSYQSVHCAATNLVIRELLDRYAGWIAVAPFDFPMRYHRQGSHAAAAVHCASLQDSPWPYADGLYTRAKTLDDKVFVQLASQLGFAQGAFKRCLDDPTSTAGIAADTALARDLGLQSVPVVFVNGLYVKGPQPVEHYAMWIDQELVRLGHDPASPHSAAARWRQPTDKVAETELPLQLSGTSVSSQPEQSTALIRIRDAAAGRFSPGDRLMPSVILGRVHESYVILRVHDHFERLSLSSEDETYVRVPKTTTTPRDEATMRRIEQPEGESRKLIEPSGVLPLGQEWLEQQLRNRAELERKFVPAEHVVDGHNLLRLEGIADSEFFTALGFEEGDVVVRVNESWVHSGQNQLWDALTSGEVVDVTFMRNGLPQRVQYVVQEKGYFEQPSDPGNAGDDGQTD